MAQKPSIPKGTRDFSPVEVAKRQYIISVIKNNFEKFGFQPIETPSFENSETLMGKYGEEGDRLIFKILNSGDYFKDVKKELSDGAVLIVNFYHILNGIFVGLKRNIEDNNIEEYFDSRLDQGLKKFFSNVNVDEILVGIFIKGYKSKIINFIKNTSSINIESVEEITFKQNIFVEFHDFYLSGNVLDLKKNSTKISEKALRYDLTVPFARYVVQHQNDIEFPFKRYQIQPVWRADRPQKGRFREFYQCDADVVGSTSLWQEVELVQLYDAVFKDLGLNGVTIKINNRKILSGIAEVIGASDKLIDFTVALDKLDKIGEEGVKNEMIEKGISASAIEKVKPLFHFTGSIQEKLAQLSVLLAASEEGLKGVAELQFICDHVLDLGLSSAVLDLDVTLARGLNYYTGAIFEVAAPKEVAMGSIGGGGRYDDLTSIFGLKNMSGVGISFGLDRIYLVIEELQLFPETVSATSKALFINYGEKEAFYAMKAIKELRNAGVKVELYPDNAKVAKQFLHADKRQIPFAVIAGETEMNDNQFSLKNLSSGEQIKIDLEGLKAQLLA